jgi:hypothetical protein
VLKNSTPAQRVKVAKELMETGKATPSLVRGALLPPAPQDRVHPGAVFAVTAIRLCSHAFCLWRHAPVATCTRVRTRVFVYVCACVCARMESPGARGAVVGSWRRVRGQDCRG